MKNEIATKTEDSGFEANRRAELIGQINERLRFATPRHLRLVWRFVLALTDKPAEKEVST